VDYIQALRDDVLSKHRNALFRTPCNIMDRPRKAHGIPNGRDHSNCGVLNRHSPAIYCIACVICEESGKTRTSTVPGVNRVLGVFTVLPVQDPAPVGVGVPHYKVEIK
jgi:hypothetical protein